MPTTLISNTDSPADIQAALDRKRTPTPPGRTPLEPEPSAPPAAPAPVAEEAPVPESSSGPATDSAPVTPPPASEPESEEDATGMPKGRFQKRLEKLLERNRLQAAEMAQLRTQVDTLLRVQPPAPPASQPPAQPPGPPQPEQFSTHEDFVRATARWEARQEFQHFARQQQQAETQRAQETTQQAQERQWLTRVTEGRAQHDDWDEAWETLGGHLTGPLEGAVITAVLESDHGAALAYHLGTHPDDLQKLQGLSPAALTRRLGALEDKLAQPPPAPPPAPRSHAPPPVNPVTGTGTTSTQATARQGESLKDYMHRRGPLTRRRY